MPSENLKKFILTMPKIELHVHLEGAINPDTAIDLIKRNNPGAEDLTVENIKGFYKFNGLSEFISGMRVVSNNIKYVPKQVFMDSLRCWLCSPILTVCNIVHHSEMPLLLKKPSNKKALLIPRFIFKSNYYQPPNLLNLLGFPTLI